ncbi:hypothetical protein AFB00_17060 [Pseudonocardia sp. HH130630-07]|nr:hypothetical protein AFB00_17060 [Pseudonocardia sp. HH130630-07]
MSRLRKTLIDTTGDERTAEIIGTGDRWTLDPSTVTADLWALQATADPCTDHAPERRRIQLRKVVGSYRDLYAADLPGLWAHSLRETTRRKFLEIINELVALDVERGDDRAAVQLLDRARTMEPRNEAIARTLITLHLRAGHLDHAEAVYDLLRVELEAIDAEPDPRTRELLTAALQP